MSPLVQAAARALPRRALSLHLAAAAALPAAAWAGLDDDRTAVAVLRGVAVLLAAALALAVDEAGAALLDASPTPLRQRLAARLLVCAAAATPLWAAALAAAAARGATVPVGALTVELAALVAVGLVAPAALRRWARVAQPALVTGPLLLAGLLGAAHLPAGAALLVSTPLDPAWADAHLRWSLLLLGALAGLALAARDPATARTSHRR